VQRLTEPDFTDYRVEHKYYISLSEAAALGERLDAVMKRDPHSDAGRGYLISSVYFDTPDGRSYLGSMLGAEKRKKIRLRAYNHKDDYICLEYKEKSGSLSRKRQLRVTRADADALLASDPTPLLSYEGEVAQQFYYDMHTNLYRPTTLVEYHRRVFLCPISDVRITFDTNLRGSNSAFDLFHPMPLRPILAPDVVLLEVKYNHFLPAFIAALLPRDCMPATSNSKFARARALP
jgi:hypothetical protein